MEPTGGRGARRAGSGWSHGQVEPHLRGRDRELRLIGELLTPTAAPGGTALIEGPAGAGKSRLLAEGAALAAARGFTLARCGVDGHRDLVPLMPLLSAVAAAGGADRCDPGPWRPPGPDPGQPLLYRLVDGMREPGGGILLAVDDLERADPAAIRRLRAAGARLPADRLAWLLARRTDADNPGMAELFQTLAAAGATRIELGPLAADATAGLLAELLGAEPGPELRALAAGAGGNPRLLVELALGLRGHPAAGAAGPETLRAQADRLLGRRPAVPVPAPRNGRSVPRPGPAQAHPPADVPAHPPAHPSAHPPAPSAHPPADAPAQAPPRPALQWRAPEPGRGGGPGPAGAAADGAAAPAGPDAGGGRGRDSRLPPGPRALLAARLPVTMAANILSRLHLAAGRVDEAVAEARLGLADAERLEQELQLPLALSTLATVALRRGELAQAAEYIERCRVPLRGAVGESEVRVAWLEGQLTAAQADSGWAMDRLAELYDDPAALRLLLAQEPVAAGWLVRNALAARDPGRARAVAVCADLLGAEYPDNPDLAAAAAHARGLLTGSGPQLRQAARCYRDPWARSSAAEDLGVLSTEHGPRPDRQQAISSLEEALSGYEATGALRDLARVRGRLRRLGVRRRHWSRTDGPVSGLTSLTGTERAVADLVAAGLTNRQVATRMFLSPHTVAFHLRHIFRKLEVSSRVELARQLARRPDSD
jgi:DNA-binding CsgD family transcriptional regulator